MKKLFSFFVLLFLLTTANAGIKLEGQFFKKINSDNMPINVVALDLSQNASITTSLGLRGHIDYKNGRFMIDLSDAYHVGSVVELIFSDSIYYSDVFVYTIPDEATEWKRLKIYLTKFNSTPIKVDGVVTDANNTVLKNVVVFALEENKQKVITDESGSFVLKVITNGDVQPLNHLNLEFQYNGKSAKGLLVMLPSNNGIRIKLDTVVNKRANVTSDIIVGNDVKLNKLYRKIREFDSLSIEEKRIKVHDPATTVVGQEVSKLYLELNSCDKDDWSLEDVKKFNNLKVLSIKIMELIKYRDY